MAIDPSAVETVEDEAVALQGKLIIQVLILVATGAEASPKAVTDQKEMAIVEAVEVVRGEAAKALKAVVDAQEEEAEAIVKEAIEIGFRRIKTKLKRF